MSTQEQEIQEVIKKNLPAHVGDVLKERLAQADRDASALEAAKKIVEQKDNELKCKEATILDYQAKDSQYLQLEIREKELEITTLKYQLETEKDKTQFSKDVALGLVRNTEYRKNIFDSENQAPFQDSNGMWIYPMATAKNHISTDEAK